MEFHKSGSAVLAILLIMSIVLICTKNILRSASYLIDIVQKRERHEQQYRATEALLHYGIAWYHQHHDKLNQTDKNNQQQSYTFDPWLPDLLPDYSGTIIIQSTGTGATVQAILNKDCHVVCKLSCQLLISKDMFFGYNYES